MNYFETTTMPNKQVEFKEWDARTEPVTPTSVDFFGKAERKYAGTIDSPLDYSCVMIPRFRHHDLAGDIDQEIKVWTQNICIAYGCRLEAIDVQLDYLHWIMAIPLSKSIDSCVRILRKKTSEKVFESYPRLRLFDAPLFWALEYSIAQGKTPHSKEQIKDFILQVRKNQGYIK